jgi:hypothetical protein
VCELFGASSKQTGNYARWLSAFRARGGETADNPDGWGLAWWQDGCAALEKAPEPGYRSERLGQLAKEVVGELVLAHDDHKNVMTMKRNLHLYVLAALLAGLSLNGHADDDIAWRHQAQQGDVMLTTNPQAPASLSAFYTARGFEAETIRPYAQSCGFSFGMRNGGQIVIVTRLADWRVVDSRGRSISFRLPETWDADWTHARVSESARIAFRWAQFQSENTFEPGDWIMGMATLQSEPKPPFRLIARYQDGKGNHEITLDKLECAHD